MRGKVPSSQRACSVACNQYSNEKKAIENPIGKKDIKKHEMRTSARAQAPYIRNIKIKTDEKQSNLGTGQTRLYQSNHTDHQAHVTYKRQWEDKRGRGGDMEGLLIEDNCCERLAHEHLKW